MCFLSPHTLAHVKVTHIQLNLSEPHTLAHVKVTHTQLNLSEKVHKKMYIERFLNCQLDNDACNVKYNVYILYIGKRCTCIRWPLLLSGIYK